MNRARLPFLAFLILFITQCQPESPNTLEGFQIHPDFQLDLVASEPLLFDPVEMKFDAQGRTYVLEMPGYPLRDSDSRLVQLKDNNKDGIYDERLVFSDSLGIATSFLPYKDGFLIAAPPHLLWIGDKDANGIEDERKHIMNGFSTGNLQHNFNGLTYGLDNWIYAANGGNSGKPYFESRPEEILNLRGNDFRFDLDNEKVELVGESSGGYKIAFDAWGHQFGTHNLEHISHLVFEDRYIKNMPGAPSHTLTNISDHDENGLSRIYPVGEQDTRVNHPEQSGYFSGACGITHYGGGMFPETFRRSLLVADCVLNLVHLDIIAKEGSSFSASRLRDKVEFLASSDRSFRPVNMTTGPDGSLYVIDIHREVIEHPEWIPDEMQEKMDLNAGKEKGRIYRIRPKGHVPNTTKRIPDAPKERVRFLGSANQWERTTAQRLLVTQDTKEAHPFLVEQFNGSDNPLARLHSMWTLQGLDLLEKDIILAALQDSHSGIRENALKIAEQWLQADSSLIKNIIAMTGDSDTRVRMRAALVLSTLPDQDYSNNSADISDAMMALLAQSENDIWAIKSGTTALRRQAFEFSEKLMALPAAAFTENQFKALSLLTELIGKNGVQKHANLLLVALDNNAMDINAKSKIIAALAKGWQSGLHPKLAANSQNVLEKALAALEGDEHLEIIRATGDLRRTMGLVSSSKLSGMIKDATQSVFNASLSVKERLDALKLIGLDAFTHRKATLFSLLNNKQPLLLQKEAIEQLWATNDRTVGPMLLELWPDLGPQTRRQATNILLYKSYNHDLLLTAMESGQVNLGEFNLDLERRRELLFSDNEDTRIRAKALFSDAGVVKRKDAIENMRPALDLAGDPIKGKEVFQALCAQCHRYGAIGTNVGPILTEINRKSKESLLHDILDPNAAVDTEYLNHRLQTNDGTVVTGLVFLETDMEIGLRMVGGNEKTVNKKDIQKFSSLGTSMMFEGLEQGLEHQEMANLLAFLQQTD